MMDTRRKTDRYRLKLLIAAGAAIVVMVALVMLSRAEAQDTNDTEDWLWQGETTCSVTHGEDGEITAKDCESVGRWERQPEDEPGPDPDPDDDNVAKADTWNALNAAQVSGEPVDGTLSIERGSEGSPGAASAAGGGIQVGTTYTVVYEVESCQPADCKVRFHLGDEERPISTGTGQVTATVKAGKPRATFTLVGNTTKAAIGGLTLTAQP